MGVVAHQGGVRGHERDAQWVSGVMVDISGGRRRQPGQGAVWSEVQPVR